MISTGNDTVHNVVGEGDVKNVENSKYKTRHGVWELFTKNGSSCQIPNTVTLAAANVSIFGIILVAAGYYPQAWELCPLTSVPLTFKSIQLGRCWH